MDRALASRRTRQPIALNGHRTLRWYPTRQSPVIVEGCQLNNRAPAVPGQAGTRARKVLIKKVDDEYVVGPNNSPPR